MCGWSLEVQYELQRREKDDEAKELPTPLEHDKLSRNETTRARMASVENLRHQLCTVAFSNTKYRKMELEIASQPSPSGVASLMFISLERNWWWCWSSSKLWS